MDDLLSEFLTETNEAIDNLDVEIVRLEQDPNDPDLLSGIFRLVHTIKGTCGFLGLPRLESVAHAGENILVKFRDGELSVTPEAVTLILESLDAIKSLLAALAKTETEPEGDDSDLIARLNTMANRETGAVSAPVVPESASEPEPLPAVAEIDLEVAPASDAAQKISTPVPSGKPLIDLVGGISAVDAAVEILYRKVMKEPELASFCDGAEMMILQGRQVEFFVALLGGPDNTTQDDNPAHKPLAMLPLSEKQFETVVDFLTASLVELEISQEGIDGVVAVYRGEREKFLDVEAIKEAETRVRAAKDEDKTEETKKNDTPLV
jgi:two-component system chemotaxis sensor kinase CheA